MKKQYIFVLGRDPELSRIEIESFLESREVEYKILSDSSHALVLELSQFSNSWADELGGTVKIAEVIIHSSRPELIEKELLSQQLYTGTSNKLAYFIDSYESDVDDIVGSALKSYFKSMRLKAMLKKETTPSRLIKKNTVEEGLEIVLFRNYIGKTIAVSNPLLVKERDISRPSADYMKTISIRLAKILVNLSMAKPSETLLDPFCGSGTILQEALLKGINVVGIDNDRKSISESQSNLKWLEKNYKLDAGWKVLFGNASTLSRCLQKADAVATEPYMGPYIRKQPSIPEAREMIAHLHSLYSSLLAELYRILKKDSRVAMIIPMFRTRENRKISMDFRTLAQSSGFAVIYGPIFYAYKESKLLRQVYVLEKL